MNRPFRFGNAVLKPKNLAALLEARQRLTSFEEHSRFVGDNYQQIKNVHLSLKKSR